MKNKEQEPREYFERSRSLVLIILIGALALDWLSLKMLMDVNPWGSAVAIPGLALTLQALWFVVHPYAVVYEDRFEIRQSLLYNKEFYYLDAKAIEGKSNHRVRLIYNDGDVESISLLGMRASHKQNFKQNLSEKINASLTNRDF